MENGQQEKFPVESQYFFKPEKEERKSFLILIQQVQSVLSLQFLQQQSFQERNAFIFLCVCVFAVPIGSEHFETWNIKKILI